MKLSRKTRRTLHTIARILDSLVMIVTLVVVLASILLTCYTLSITAEALGYSASVGQAHEDAKAYPPANRQEYIDEVYLEVQEDRAELYHENRYNEWFFLELNKFLQFIMIAAQITFSVCAGMNWYNAYCPELFRRKS